MILVMSGNVCGPSTLGLPRSAGRGAFHHLRRRRHAAGPPRALPGKKQHGGGCAASLAVQRHRLQFGSTHPVPSFFYQTIGGATTCFVGTGCTKNSMANAILSSWVTKVSFQRGNPSFFPGVTRGFGPFESRDERSGSVMSQHLPVPFGIFRTAKVGARKCEQMVLTLKLPSPECRLRV